MFYLFIFIGLVFGINKGLTKVLPHHFYVPPQDWRQKIDYVLNYPKPIYLKVGKKGASIRRRLILASRQPSYYTNYINNKVKINPNEDKDDFKLQMTKRSPQDPDRKLIFGFFHPYANNGGGGERVLWQAVKSTLEDPRNIVAVYTTNLDCEPLQILSKTKQKFQINLDESRVVFIYLRRFNNLIDSNYWKHFTLLGQLFGSILLTFEAINQLSPDIWVDTMGLPASYLPISKVLKIPILSYVHYPIIQQDMFNKLKFKKFKLNIFTQIKSFSDMFQLFKLIYWSILYWIYVYLGSLVNITLTNGSWTQNHMSNIWIYNKLYNNSIDIVYPPCGPEKNQLQIDVKRDNKLLYISQFRPEKRHKLIIDQYFNFLKMVKSEKIPINKIPTLVFLGSCRTTDDTTTLTELKDQVKQLQLEDYVEFVVDCSYQELLTWLNKVEFGLNAMWNEHFGIGVVEYLYGGAIPIVHASAGPYLDIVQDGSQTEVDYINEIGFFFKDETDPDFEGKKNEQGELIFNNKCFPSLSQLLYKMITNPDIVSQQNLQNKRLAAEKVLPKFSNEAFDSKWKSYCQQLQAIELQLRLDRESEVEMVY